MMLKRHSSSRIARMVSAASCLTEKKPLAREMLPTRRQSRSWKLRAQRGGVSGRLGRAGRAAHHIASLRSLVVSQPMVPPAPSESATHLVTLARWIACTMCWHSNLRTHR